MHEPWVATGLLVNDMDHHHYHNIPRRSYGPIHGPRWLLPVQSVPVLCPQYSPQPNWVAMELTANSIAKLLRSPISLMHLLSISRPVGPIRGLRALRCHSTWLQTASTTISQIKTLGSGAPSGVAALPWLRNLSFFLGRFCSVSPLW